MFEKVTFKEQRRGGLGVIGYDKKKEDDSLKSVYVAGTHNYLLIFSNKGKCYWLKVWQVPEGSRRSKGRPLVNFIEGIDKDERIATILPVTNFEDEEICIVLATKNGVVKKVDLQAFSNPRRKGIYAISIDEDDALIDTHLVSKGKQVMLFTRNGMAIRFDEGNVRAMGRTARGVKGISLREDDYVVHSEVVSGDENILVVCDKGFGKRSLVEDFRQTNRGGVGVKSIVTNDRNGLVIGALSVEDETSVIMMSQQGQSIRIRMDECRIMGRSTQGVKLSNLKDNDRIIAIQKVNEIDAEVDEATEAETAEAQTESE